MSDGHPGPAAAGPPGNLPVDAWHVGVPASSANLGPGFDAFAGALTLRLGVTVRPGRAFAVETALAVPHDRSNLVVRAFERLHPADGVHFEIASEIPLSGGLGSSAAAIVAGLVAADRVSGAGAAVGDVYRLACELEGHPDNVAAALHGGFVVCADGEVHRLDPPPGIEALLVVPDEAVRTSAARAALPVEVPLAQAAFNTAHGALLMLGLAAGDWELVARGLADQLHQARRAHLFPRSYELLGRSGELGALGATISGAGPTVLFWCRAERGADLRARLARETAGWAQVIRAGFAREGAVASAGI